MTIRNLVDAYRTIHQLNELNTGGRSNEFWDALVDGPISDNQEMTAEALVERLGKVEYELATILNTMGFDLDDRTGEVSEEGLEHFIDDWNADDSLSASVKHPKYVHNTVYKA